MSQFEVGDWVRLVNICDMHPSKAVNGRAGETPPREFIGVYEGNHRVSWLSSELPVEDLIHWCDGCLELFQRAPKAV